MEEKLHIDEKPVTLRICKLWFGRVRENNHFTHEKRIGRNDCLRYNKKTIYRWYSMFERNDKTIIMLLGNKCDLTERREVGKEEGEKIASELGIKFMETSGRQYINVKETFNVLARDMIKREYKCYEKLMMRFVLDFPKTAEETNMPELAVKDILRYGVEKNYHIRVMVVGNENVGKTTLVRRLLKEPVSLRKYISTNGIDVLIHSSDVDIETGAWEITEAHEMGWDNAVFESNWK